MASTAIREGAFGIAPGPVLLIRRSDDRFHGDDVATLVLPPLGADPMRKLRFLPVGAGGERFVLGEVVRPARAGPRFRVASCGIRHGGAPSVRTGRRTDRSNVFLSGELFPDSE